MDRIIKGAAAAALLALIASCHHSSPAASAGGNGGNSPPPIPAGDNIFMAIVPPGSNGNSAGGIGAPAVIPTSDFVYPKNFRDQLDMYGDLAYAKTPLKADTCAPPADISQHVKSSDQACNYFKAAPLTITDAQAVSTRTLTAPNGKSVTIRRDGWGVPYIEGDDRSSAEYGAGFAAAQDRLWLFDILRNVGRGRASAFLGPSPTTYDLDSEFGVPGGYSEDELTTMVNNTVSKLGPLGPIFLNDTQMFVAGMNAYISYLQGAGVTELPPEYATLAAGNLPKFPPAPFTVNDIVANAVLIQSALGRGGGGEATNLQLLQKLDPTFDSTKTQISQAACEMWRDLRHADIPDTPHTIDKAFPTQSPASLDETCPQTVPPGTAIWDVGSLQGRAFMTHAAGLPTGLPASSGGGSSATIPFSGMPSLGLPATRVASRNPGVKQKAKLTTLYASTDPKSLKRMLNKYGVPMTTSNWIAVAASLTQSGHPIAVAGPQTGYDVPQLLWESAVVSHGGTPLEIAARGISTVNLPYVVIGHGLDFAWSPTSAESDIQDTRVSKLCNTNGTPVTAASRNDADGDGFPDADGYVYKGQCVKLYKRVDSWTAYPTAASVALGGNPVPDNVKRYILRTHYGPVTATATVGGAPVVISIQRSTFLSDVDTAAPFALLTTTGKPMNSVRFRQLFNSMSSVFNWLYIDKNDIAYITSGLYPVRHAGINPDLPQWGDGNYEWAADEGFDPTQYGGDTPFPARTVPVAQTADPLDGYFEWQGWLPLAAHIQEVNPPKGYMASWNNSGAPGWWAADSNGTFGPTHRVQSLFLRLKAFVDSGRKFDIANMIEVMGDAAYTDLRGYDVLPQILALMKAGTLTADQQQVVDLMQAWMDTGSRNWIDGGKGLGAFRRDRDASGTYDFRAQVVLMDAWYAHMMDAVLPQMAALDAQGVSVLTGRYDAPRAQGSAYQEGWFQHMRRVFETVLETPGHQDYRSLKCAGTGVLADCRKAVLDSLDAALADLGGLSNQANWSGAASRYGDCPSSSIPGQSVSSCNVEDYDSVRHTSFSFLPVPAIHWINRPTFQQA
ncbi:MAG TPA: penicillin acylase family protein, partial [Nevskiaceae bacterium]|nr:penicillin acylase family protein [Nevskiaceae bacterium]